MSAGPFDAEAAALSVLEIASENTFEDARPRVVVRMQRAYEAGLEEAARYVEIEGRSPLVSLNIRRHAQSIRQLAERKG